MYLGDKVILTDCDGVLVDWKYSFCEWVSRHGYTVGDNVDTEYKLEKVLNIPKDEKKKIVKMFNESAAIGFIPPHKDAMYYVDLLHRKHGYVFHCITSMSLEPTAHMLRRQNLERLFGPTAIEKYIFLDTGADKDDALRAYEGTDCIWIEDNLKNAAVGTNFGLKAYLMEHGYNNYKDSEYPNVTRIKNWKDIYEQIV